MTAQQVLTELQDALDKIPVAKDWPMRFQGGQGKVYDFRIDQTHHEVVLYTRNS